MARHRQCDRRAIVPDQAIRRGRRFIGDIVLAYETIAREAHAEAQVGCPSSCPSCGARFSASSRLRSRARTRTATNGKTRAPRYCGGSTIPDPYRPQAEAPKMSSNKSRFPTVNAGRTRCAQIPMRGESTESEHRGLPALVPQPGEAQPDGWLARVIRILFGWKAAATRADLEHVLTAEQPASGFSPEEAAHAQEYPHAARMPDRARHGAARRYRRSAA